MFSDLTKREFERIYLTANFEHGSGNGPKNGRKNKHHHSRRLQGSMSINWVDEGAVTSIRNQGQCGSCWAFAASGAIESGLLIYSDQQYSPNSLHVSEQQQVDCVTTSYGCDGGWSEHSLQYAQTNGLTSGQSYPYNGYDGHCKKTGG